MTTEGSPDLFGRWLDLTMRNRDITGRKIARRLGVHDSAVSRWRSGQGVPAMDTCMRLAQILDVDPIRLAITAGLMDGSLAGAEVLPLPEPTAQRRAIKDQLRKIRGLPSEDTQRLVDFYEVTQMLRETDGDDNLDQLRKAVDALDAVRHVIRGNEGAKST